VSIIAIPTEFCSALSVRFQTLPFDERTSEKSPLTAMHYGRDQLARSASEHHELIPAFEARDVGWAHAVMTGHIRRAFHAFRGVAG
jgi:DNA-binding GntR family transcriptional regulator